MNSFAIEFFLAALFKCSNSYLQSRKPQGHFFPPSIAWDVGNTAVCMKLTDKPMNSHPHTRLLRMLQAHLEPSRSRASTVLDWEMGKVPECTHSSLPIRIYFPRKIVTNSYSTQHTLFWFFLLNINGCLYPPGLPPVLALSLCPLTG